MTRALCSHGDDRPVILRAEGLKRRFVSRGQRVFQKSSIWALDNVSLNIRAGQSVGLVGESGAGKSTLARVLARLEAPDAGQIWLDGENITSLSPEKFARSPARRRIQMVFQDSAGSLNNRFSSYESIADPLRMLTNMTKGEIDARVRETADRVGLPLHLLDRYPSQLSGGEQARVNLARALVVEPQLLILDEPTSSLDASMQAVVLHLLNRLRHETGMSLLFITHDLHVVRLMCEHMLVMQSGRVIEEGKTAEIFEMPREAHTRALIEALPRPPQAVRKP